MPGLSVVHHLLFKELQMVLIVPINLKKSDGHFAMPPTFMHLSPATLHKQTIPAWAPKLSDLICTNFEPLLGQFKADIKRWDPLFISLLVHLGLMTCSRWCQLRFPWNILSSLIGSVVCIFGTTNALGLTCAGYRDQGLWWARHSKPPFMSSGFWFGAPGPLDSAIWAQPWFSIENALYSLYIS